MDAIDNNIYDEYDEEWNNSIPTLIVGPIIKELTPTSLELTGTVLGDTTKCILIVHLNNEKTLEVKDFEANGNFTCAFSNLTPQTYYYVSISIKIEDPRTGDYFLLDTTDRTPIITPSFKTADEIVSIRLSPVKKLVDNKFKISFWFNPTSSTWPEWFSSGIKGYEISIFVNSSLRKTINLNTSKIGDDLIALLDKEIFDLRELSLHYNDSIQVGVRAYIKSNNEINYNSELLKYSNSYYLRERFYIFNRIYLRTTQGIRRVSFFWN